MAGNPEMTPDEIRSIREKLGLSQAGLAAALGLGKNGGRTVRRYEDGECNPSGSVVRLMEIFRDHPELLSYLTEALPKKNAIKPGDLVTGWPEEADFLS